MRRTLLGMLIGGLWLFALPPVEAGDVDINVNLGGPPPVVRFEREPEFVVIPESRVWRLPEYEYDFYRYDDDYYLNRDGYWYRAKTWRGPFVALPFDDLPNAIVGLPGKYRKHPAHPHGGPPGQLKKHGIEAARGQKGGRDKSGGGHKGGSHKGGKGRGGGKSKH